MDRAANLSQFKKLKKKIIGYQVDAINFIIFLNKFTIIQ